MTYGAYLPQDFSIARGAGTIVLADTLIALLAGFVVFPAVFHFGLDMASGPGLIFKRYRSLSLRCLRRRSFLGAVFHHAGGGGCDVDGGATRRRDQLDERTPEYLA